MGIELGMTGEQAAEKYVRQRTAMGKFRPLTARNTRYHLASWMAFVEDWQDPTLDEAIDWCTVPESPDAKHRRASAIRAFYKHAWAHKWISADVSGQVPSIAGGENKPKPIPDKALLEALRRVDPALRPALILGRYAGLRAGEIASVHRDDLSRGELHVPEGKGGRERWVQAHPEVTWVVSRADGWMFPSKVTGTHVSAATMSSWIAAALPAPWTAHTLRHAFATELYDSTGDLVLVASQLGHKSARTTERYIRVRNEKAMEAVARMKLVA